MVQKTAPKTIFRIKINCQIRGSYARSYSVLFNLLLVCLEMAQRRQHNSKGNIILTFILKPSYDLYTTIVAGRLRHGEGISRWASSKSGVEVLPVCRRWGNHSLYVNFVFARWVHLSKKKLTFFPSTLRFKDLILESSGWKANMLAIIFFKLLHFQPTLMLSQCRSIE